MFICRVECRLHTFHFQALYDSATTQLSGPVEFRHTFIDMSNVSVMTVNGTKVSICTLGHTLAHVWHNPAGQMFGGVSVEVCRLVEGCDKCKQ